jgi:hypothetical protein
MTCQSEKRLQSKQQSNYYSKRGIEPPQAMTRGEVHLAFFLLVQLDILAPTCWIIYGNERGSLSRLMVATQQVGEKNEMELKQGMADYGLMHRKRWLNPMP